MTRNTRKNSCVKRSPCASTRLSALAAHAQGTLVANAGDGLERFLQLPPVQIGLGGRQAGAERFGPPRVVLEHGDEPIVFVEGQAAQHDGVDDGENRRAGANAERQNCQRNGCERW